MTLSSAQKKGKVLTREVERELLIQELEKHTEEERNDLIKFMQYMFKYEKKKEFFPEKFHILLVDKLKGVLDGKIQRLMINLPPRSWKSELITKCFPVWALGNNPQLEFISTSYSATLAAWFSAEARDYYMSDTFKQVFPRADELHETQNTKDNWKTTSNWWYYATGAGWAITWKWANIFIIDDPLKPDEIDSDLKRHWINSRYENTVTSRLNNPKTDSIIIVAQRLHDWDLCWHLQEKMREWTWDDWDVVELPAIMEETEIELSNWETIKFENNEILYPSKFTHKILNDIKKLNPQVFYSQFLQNPANKENAEFHFEWFKYYDDLPNEFGRTFTTCDPAFALKTTSDESVITTVKFFWDKMYILEQTSWKFDPAVLEDKMIYHIKKWDPEVIGVESIAAQVTIAFSLRRRLLKEEIHKTQIEEIRQRKDKNAKIRALIPLYRNWLIYHKRNSNESEDLEAQLLRFPFSRRDDKMDGLQMALYCYELTPWMKKHFKMPTLKYNKYWLPVII